MNLDLLATGYPSLDYLYRTSRSPAEDETAILESFSPGYTYGGCGLNIATALAKLGFRTGVAVVLGDDVDGKSYLRYLNNMGVDTVNLVCLPQSATSRAYIFLNPQGRYQLFFYPGAAGEWRPPLRLEGLDKVKACLLTVGAPQYTQAFVDCVLEAGVPLLWQMKADVQAYPPDKLGRLICGSKIIFMNETENRYLMQAAGVGTVSGLLNDPDQVIVITRGARGSTVCTSHGLCEVPPVHPRQFVDSTGAGDGFTAGFLAGWFKGLPLEVCARLGAVLASFVLEEIGCQTNLPGWPQLAERYQAFFLESLENR